MSDLREKVAKAKYEEKRARLLEAFGDTAGWPEWENLKQTLKEIEMEEHDAAIAIVLEEAARVADDHRLPLGDFCAPYKIAAAIRALANPASGS